MKRLKIGDLIAIIVIILSALSLYLYGYLNYPKAQGDRVIIEVDGEIVKIFELPQKEKIVYKVNIDEDDYNLVEILNNRVRVKEATCPEQIDVKQGWIEKPGEIIVCLPHKLVVKIEGEEVEEESEVDTKTY